MPFRLLLRTPLLTRDPPFAFSRRTDSHRTLSQLRSGPLCRRPVFDSHSRHFIPTLSSRLSVSRGHKKTERVPWHRPHRIVPRAQRAYLRAYPACLGCLIRQGPHCSAQPPAQGPCLLACTSPTPHREVPAVLLHARPALVLRQHSTPPRPPVRAHPIIASPSEALHCIDIESDPCLPPFLYPSSSQQHHPNALLVLFCLAFPFSFLFVFFSSIFFLANARLGYSSQTRTGPSYPHLYQPLHVYMTATTATLESLPL